VKTKVLSIRAALGVVCRLFELWNLARNAGPHAHHFHSLHSNNKEKLLQICTDLLL
jgi:hypothetical protein